MRLAILSLALTKLLPAAEMVSYEDHVLPVFEQACLNCHNPDKTKGGLDLSNYAGVMKGGSSGKIVEPGDTSSTLVNLVKHTAEPVMPPEGEKLSATQITLIEKWIEGGLLETKSSTAKKPSKPKFEIALRSDPAKAPDGPPPMPEHLLLEPPVVTRNAAAVRALAASPWAPLIAITGQQQILLHDTESLELVGILPFPEGEPISLGFTPDGRYLIAGGGIPGKNGLTVTFDVTSGARVLTAGKEFDSILASDIRPAFDIIATGGPSKLLKLWDTQSGEQIQSIKKHTDWITALDISPDGILLASGGRDGGLHVWEAESANEFHTLRAHQAGISALAFRSDSNLLASASEDGTLRFWEMNHGTEVKKLDAHPGGVTTFAFAKDGSFVSAGRDHKAKIWTADFKPLREIKLPALPSAAAIDWKGQRAFVADARGAVHVFPLKQDTETALRSFASNPPSIKTRLSTISKQISKTRDKIRSLTESTKIHDRSIQEEQIKLAAAEKALSQANQILQASQKGAEEARKYLESLVKEPSTKPEEIEKARTAHRAAMQTKDLAQARIRPAEAEVEAARKALAGLQKPVETTKSMAEAKQELRKLELAEKKWTAASINTRLIESREACRELTHQHSVRIDEFQKALTELSVPASALNEKRAERTEFASSLIRSNLVGSQLEEAEATLRAIEATIENLRDELFEQENQLTEIRHTADLVATSLATSKATNTKLQKAYQSALR
ncbi:c-type cytochrome domain-containing protein [Luteolibacter algae]|uniref:C-type cytochrome domain-containing protein n=1 Tax=Luteolibacter algae TaxID=454151 RepID=A0ABW5D5D3_9BACT